MLSNSNAQLILDEFRLSLSELIECYTNITPDLSLAESEGPGGEMTAIIGLCDHMISASISLTTTCETAKNLSETAPLNARDWLGELSNQVAGRLKNKLGRYGHYPNLSTPTTVAGTWLQVQSMGMDSFILVAKFNDNEVTAQLTLDLSQDLSFDEVAEHSTAEEGSCVLF